MHCVCPLHNTRKSSLKGCNQGNDNKRMTNRKSTFSQTGNLRFEEWLKVRYPAPLTKHLQLFEVFGNGECPFPLHFRYPFVHREDIRNSHLQHHLVGEKHLIDTSSAVIANSFSISITMKLDCSLCYDVVDVIPNTDFSFQPFPLPSAEVKKKRCTSKLQTN